MLDKTRVITLDSIQQIEKEFLEEEGNLLFKEVFNAPGSKERMVVLSIARGCHTPGDMDVALEDGI